MDLRVLHAIAHGQTWYGRWGYAFGRGTHNLPLAQWEAAVRRLHKVQLTALWPDAMGGSTAGTPLADVLHRYASSTAQVGLVLES